MLCGLLFLALVLQAGELGVGPGPLASQGTPLQLILNHHTWVWSGLSCIFSLPTSLHVATLLVFSYSSDGPPGLLFRNLVVTLSWSWEEMGTALTNSIILTRTPYDTFLHLCL